MIILICFYLIQGKKFILGILFYVFIFHDSFISSLEYELTYSLGWLLVCVSQILLTRHISENVSFNILYFLVSHLNNLGSCCDMDQSDTIGKIELFPFPTCQAMILIAVRI